MAADVVMAAACSLDLCVAARRSRDAAPARNMTSNSSHQNVTVETTANEWEFVLSRDELHDPQNAVGFADMAPSSSFLRPLLLAKVGRSSLLTIQ